MGIYEEMHQTVYPRQESFTKQPVCKKRREKNAFRRKKDSDGLKKRTPAQNCMFMHQCIKRRIGPDD